MPFDFKSCDLSLSWVEQTRQRSEDIGRLRARLSKVWRFFVQQIYREHFVSKLALFVLGENCFVLSRQRQSNNPSFVAGKFGNLCAQAKNSAVRSEFSIIVSLTKIILSHLVLIKINFFLKKMGQSRPFFVSFWSFHTNRCEKCHVHPVYSTGIQTHNP